MADQPPDELLTPTREEFLYFSFAEKLLFYALVFLCLAAMVAQIWKRVRLWQTGVPLTPKPWQENLQSWSRNLGVYVLGQRKVRSSRPTSGAPMHLAIFYGFLTLFLATTLLGINTYSPIKFHFGIYYLVYEWVADVMGLVFMIGVVWAFIRRYRMMKDPANPMASEPADLYTLGLLFFLAATGYWLEATRMSVNPHSFDVSAPVGHLWSMLQGDWRGPQQQILYKSVWWIHAVGVFAFFVTLPRMRIRHIIMAIFTTASFQEKPMGWLKPITIEEVERTEQVGVKLAKDYSRWNLMSLDACMGCGRCTEVCPAWNVGKVLNPQQIVQDTKLAMERGDEVAPRISPDALWQCTTCNACVEACPVLIQHVDLIVDVRRNLVSEGQLSGSAATMLRQTASTGHAWGAPRNQRETWMAGLGIPLCRDSAPFEYLFWVGCAGATDAGAVKTTQAVAELLEKAGVSFACLGEEEACTGDPARRVGEEFLFQEKAAENISVFDKYGVKKIVTACPHCFNSFKNEYGDFGATIEVFHHSQLLAELVSKGALLAATPKRGSVSFHDPCYLGRVNNETEAPRALLGEVTDPIHHGTKTLCCGAGGGRMWMDEPADQRPSHRRAEELVATGATTIALACPFCRIMLDSSIKQVTTDEIRLVDLAELLQESNR